MTAEEAAHRIPQTTNPIGRKRDLAVLQAAAAAPTQTKKERGKAKPNSENLDLKFS